MIVGQRAKIQIAMTLNWNRWLSFISHTYELIYSCDKAWNSTHQHAATPEKSKNIEHIFEHFLLPHKQNRSLIPTTKTHTEVNHNYCNYGTKTKCVIGSRSVTAKLRKSVNMAVFGFVFCWKSKDQDSLSFFQTTIIAKVVMVKKKTLDSSVLNPRWGLESHTTDTWDLTRTGTLWLVSNLYFISVFINNFLTYMQTKIV